MSATRSDTDADAAAVRDALAHVYDGSGVARYYFSLWRSIK